MDGGQQAAMTVPAEPPGSRWPLWRRLTLAGAAVVALALCVLDFAVHDAKARILHALGPRATVGDIRLDYPRVTLNDVRIAADPAPGAWPSDEEFHAKRVEIRITARALWAYRQGQPLAIDDVRVEDGTLVVRRRHDRLDMLPALRRATQANVSANAPANVSAIVSASVSANDIADVRTDLVVRRTHVEHLAVDLFDDAPTTGTAPCRLRFEQVHGHIDAVALPTLSRPIALGLQGVLKGVERDGTVRIEGTLTPAAHDADLAVSMTGVDLRALQPYVKRFGDDPVRHGRLDLTLDAHVAGRALHAPGHLSVTGLEFDEAGRSNGRSAGDIAGDITSDIAGHFAGLGRRAALAALTRNGRLDLAFTIGGRPDEPSFALDEAVAPRIVAGLGKAVGSGARDVAEGVGGAVKGVLGRRGDVHRDDPRANDVSAPRRASSPT